MAELLVRIETLQNCLRKPQAVAETEALIGTAPKASIKISKAFDLYCDKITVGDLKGKSPAQRKNWRKVKNRAVQNFIKLRGDKPMSDVTREDGQAFYEWWGARVDPKDGSKPMNANSANKDLTSLRILFREFWAYEGEPKRDNPFADLRSKNFVYRSIPPFSADWIETKLLGGWCAVWPQVRSASPAMRADRNGLSPKRDRKPSERAHHPR